MYWKLENCLPWETFCRDKILTFPSSENCVSDLIDLAVVPPSHAAHPNGILSDHCVSQSDLMSCGLLCWLHKDHVVGKLVILGYKSQKFFLLFVI